MNCLPCAQSNDTEASVAVCHHCGAGLCSRHLVEKEVVITKTVMIGREVPLPEKARQILCEVCDHALSQEL